MTKIWKSVGNLLTTLVKTDNRLYIVMMSHNSYCSHYSYLYCIAMGIHETIHVHVAYLAQEISNNKFQYDSIYLLKIPMLPQCQCSNFPSMFI